jgi:putative Holliday junction resolvase
VRYLGVDPGGKRVGLALADDETGIVVPLKVIAYGGLERAAEELARTAAELAADCVVIGLPTSASGEPTAACARSQALATALEERGHRVALQGEYLSTNEARRRAREAGLKRDQPIDHLAAQVLLEEYLDRR